MQFVLGCSVGNIDGGQIGIVSAVAVVLLLTEFI